MQNLNKLHYPLFKITLNEACLLSEGVRKVNPCEYTFLCPALRYIGEELHMAKCERVLHKKIVVALNYHSTLDSYLGISGSITFGELHKLRKIWVKKLLKHNGYM